VLHGPIEWSIHCGYDAIVHRWKQSDVHLVFQLSNGPGWLGEAILHSARFASGRYEVLLDGYDCTQTLTDPLQALTADARAALSEWVGLSMTGWARVLERAGRDAEQIRGGPLPRSSAVIPSVLAVIRAPAKRTRRWIEHRRYRVATMDLLHEWRSTGKLEYHVPPEVDIVHRVVRVREDEKRWKQDRTRRLASRNTAIGVKPGATAIRRAA
jgi:hypothetical protein